MNQVLRKHYDGKVVLKSVPNKLSNGSACIQNVLTDLLSRANIVGDFSHEQLWDYILKQLELQDISDFILFGRSGDNYVRYYYSIDPDYWNGIIKEGVVSAFSRYKAVSCATGVVSDNLRKKNVCFFEYGMSVFTQLQAFGIIDKNYEIPDNWAWESVPPQQTRPCVTPAWKFAKPRLFVNPGGRGKTSPFSYSSNQHQSN